MIYLDNNATTPLDPHVAESMGEMQREFFGNPSSIHRLGQRAKALLFDATRRVAEYLEVTSDEVIFTSGATEALNLVIRSAMRGGHILTSSLEHVAVLEPLKRTGCRISYLDPELGRGALTPRQVEEAITAETSLIVLTAANNETGVLTDLEGIADVAERFAIPLIVDGVALLGKGPFHMPKGVSAFCVSGHKIHGPVGVGCAIVRPSFQLDPLIYGGPQQKGRRGGTENLIAIAAFAKALELIDSSDSSQWERMEQLRDSLEEALLLDFPDLMIHGKEERRVANVTNLAFPGVDGETLLMNLDLAGVAVSHGSACSSGTLEPSRVLLNMGVPTPIARSSIRLSLSRLTTAEEIDRTVEILKQLVSQLRAFQKSPQ